MKVLLLAGTGEARALARLLAQAGIDATASLAGATCAPAPLAIATRTGGFTGEGAQKKYMQDNGFTHVIDATHPFAARISERTCRLASTLGLPYLHVLRPPWVAGPGDRWLEVDRLEEAARHIPPGARVLLTIGPGSLAGIHALRGRRLLCRRIDRTPLPESLPDGLRFIEGRPPFRVEDEIETMKKHKTEWLVVKNSGGEGGRAKLDAAREQGLSVLMIRRPAQPDAPRVGTAEAAMAWLGRA